MNATTIVRAAVCNEAYAVIGYVELRGEEVEHFSSTGSVPASIALDCNQIAALGIDEDTYVYIREA